MQLILAKCLCSFIAAILQIGHDVDNSTLNKITRRWYLSNIFDVKILLPRKKPEDQSPYHVGVYVCVHSHQPF